MKDVALTETARLAVSVNSKHREVQRLGRTAKEIAAEIGEELIKVKAQLKHGEFIPWVKAECSFSQDMANKYMKVALAKIRTRSEFDRCDSIREVLALGKTPKEPPKQTRSATLDDLRKVERLRALRDDPSATEGERAAAKAKLDKIEAEVGPVEPKAKTKTKPNTRHAVRLRACAVMDKVAPTLTGNPRSMIISALMVAYGDTPEKIEELLETLKGNK